MLKTRALSALVLAPPALLAAWIGGFAFAALVAVAAALGCWEWHRMIDSGRFGLGGRIAALGCLIAVPVAVIWPVAAVLIVMLTAVAGFFPGERSWPVAGVLYAGLPAVALVWLRADPGDGGAVVCWLLLVVWSTDVGAYAFGRIIGGPLLLPSVSPKKTWAGLLGGMLCAALAGGGVVWVLDRDAVVVVALVSALTAVVAQIGDLFESWVKRRWGVKDSSNIIPGHGGVLDRIDGLLAAAAAAALLTLARGQAVLIW